MTDTQASFLSDPPSSDATESAYAEDRAEDGYVWNVTRLWSWRPDLSEAFGALRSQLMQTSALGDRDFAVLVAAMAGALGDSYCSLAWGEKLAHLSDGATAAAVLTGSETSELSNREAALATWTRKLVRDPNATTAADVEMLRDAGLDDREIFEATLFAALRLAFSTVNDALGTPPDLQLAEAALPEVRAAVSFGRPPGAEPSPA